MDQIIHIQAYVSVAQEGAGQAGQPSLTSTGIQKGAHRQEVDLLSFCCAVQVVLVCQGKSQGVTLFNWNVSLHEFTLHMLSLKNHGQDSARVSLPTQQGIGHEQGAFLA
eukprot:1140045-Pelagomonas_calceolata.AAC.4